LDATDIYSYLRAHANELGSRILEQFPPIQSTTDETPAELSTLLRTPLPAQAIAIGGLAKHFKSARAARIVAECGAGKTFMALGLAQVLQAHDSRDVSFASWEEMGTGGDPDHSVCTHLSH
jgi:hypothetical protein